MTTTDTFSIHCRHATKKNKRKQQRQDAAAAVTAAAAAVAVVVAAAAAGTAGDVAWKSGVDGSKTGCERFKNRSKTGLKMNDMATNVGSVGMS